ncbi:unnamed protein product [Amoebophrya sp. A25]|nr:unnamed protein product [Amoebophrya sp. A25]|eukprot:GSA25T00025845001.1
MNHRKMTSPSTSSESHLNVKRVMIVVNPASGNGRAKGIHRKLEAALTAKGIKHDTFRTRCCGDAIRFCAGDGENTISDFIFDGTTGSYASSTQMTTGTGSSYAPPSTQMMNNGDSTTSTTGSTNIDALAVVGGDGTMNECLNGLAQRRRRIRQLQNLGTEVSDIRDDWPIALFPGGTGNDGATFIGVHTFDSALAALLGGKIRDYDVGIAQTHQKKSACRSAGNASKGGRSPSSRGGGPTDTARSPPSSPSRTRSTPSSPSSWSATVSRDEVLEDDSTRQGEGDTPMTADNSTRTEEQTTTPSDEPQERIFFNLVAFALAVAANNRAEHMRWARGLRYDLATGIEVAMINPKKGPEQTMQLWTRKEEGTFPVTDVGFSHKAAEPEDRMQAKEKDKNMEYEEAGEAQDVESSDTGNEASDTGQQLGLPQHQDPQDNPPDETWCFDTGIRCLFLQNAPFGGFNLPLVPLADPFDGFLDVVWVPNVLNRWQFLKLVYLLKTGGRHLQHPEVKHRLCDRVRIESKPEAEVVLDGESCGVTPLDIRVKARFFRIFCPP